MKTCLIIDNVTLHPHEPETILQDKLFTLYECKSMTFEKILRKSLDARKKNSIVYRYRILVSVGEEDRQHLLSHDECSVYNEPVSVSFSTVKKDIRVPIVGTGPAGLFCALALSESGVGVDLYERGKPVEQRMRDIGQLKQHGILDENSNILFGEGGAGTYSDGKLVSRSSGAESRWFFEKMVELGAPENILYDAKPHVGTDKLIPVLKNLRGLLENRGCRFYFSKMLTDISVRDNRLFSFSIDEEEIPCSPFLVLATGHSARGVYDIMLHRGVSLQPKGFAVGVRVEHPVELINTIQYGESWEKKGLPAAEYRLAWKNPKTGRGVYTFCMCPGGEIVNSSSEQDMLCINGMSYSQRNGRYSNAAVVVAVHPEDFGNTPLGGVEFQRILESAAFRVPGGGFIAPVQRVSDFVDRKRSRDAFVTTYSPAVSEVDMTSILPEWIYVEIAEGIVQFGRKMKGYYSNEGICVGVETRTSSPVRISRDESYQSVSCRGLVLVGEGAGYAGGIVSSAVDGIRAAKKIIAYYENV
ncbi:MAG: NAD(P)/FAD-dependent oxidoreductase [Spirochaetota bacterium]